MIEIKVKLILIISLMIFISFYSIVDMFLNP